MISAFEPAEMPEASVCSSGAGTYNMGSQAVGMALFRPGKERTARDLRPVVVAISCPACYVRSHDGLGDSISVGQVAVHPGEACREAHEPLGVRAA